MKWMIALVLFAASCSSDKLVKENELLKERTMLLIAHQNVSDSLCNAAYANSKAQLEARKEEIKKKLFDIDHEIAKLKFNK